MGDNLSDKEIDLRIKKAVELEREALKAMGIPLIQWDDDLDCIVRVMPDGTKVKVPKEELVNDRQ